MEVTQVTDATILRLVNSRAKCNPQLRMTN